MGSASHRPGSDQRDLHASPGVHSRSRLQYNGHWRPAAPIAPQLCYRPPERQARYIPESCRTS